MFAMTNYEIVSSYNDQTVTASEARQFMQARQSLRKGDCFVAYVPRENHGCRYHRCHLNSQ